MCYHSWYKHTHGYKCRSCSQIISNESYILILERELQETRTELAKAKAPGAEVFESRQHIINALTLGRTDSSVITAAICSLESAEQLINAYRFGSKVV